MEKLEFDKYQNMWGVYRISQPECIGKIVTYDKQIRFDPLLLDDPLTLSELRQIADFCEKQGG
jgi:hypothetical protein